MERTTLWSRVGDWIKHPRRSMGWDVTEIDDSQIGPPQTYTASNGDHDPSEPAAHKRHWLTLGGNRRLIEDQNRQVSDLVQSLQGHVQRQTEVAETANQNLERLIASLSALPAVMQAQQQALGRIQTQLEAQPSGQKQVQEVLTQLGGIRDAVKESSSAFARYSEVAQKSSETVSAELTKQGQAVAQLAQSADPMMRAVSALRADVSSRAEELSNCVTTLNTKLVQFASAALILALIAAIIGIVAFFR
jgi:DNA repair ATPase RecN